MEAMSYKVLVEPLSVAEGGGYLATVPELPGCMSDGETPEQAIEHVHDAIIQWIDAAKSLGQPIPVPTSLRQAS
jgi:predicted RNase H-like HicB family nuclease